MCEGEGEKRKSDEWGKNETNGVPERDRARPRRNVECIWGVLCYEEGSLHAARARNWAQPCLSVSVSHTLNSYTRSLIRTATNTHTHKHSIHLDLIKFIFPLSDMLT